MALSYHKAKLSNLFLKGGLFIDLNKVNLAFMPRAQHTSIIQWVCFTYSLIFQCLNTWVCFFLHPLF